MEALDLERGLIRFINRYHFINLNRFIIYWVVLEDGSEILSGSIPHPDLAPGESKILDIDLENLKLRKGAEYLLNVSVQTSQPSELVPKGHEVAREQFVLPFKVQTGKTELPNKLSLQMSDTQDFVQIKGENFSVRFDKVTGLLSSFAYRGTELIMEGPSPNFWRAPTDNDFGNGMPKRCAVWKTASSHRQLDRFEIVKQDPTQIEIEAGYTLQDVESKHTVTYTLLNTGDLIIKNHFIPGKMKLPELLRFGMRMRVPKNLQQVQWYGRGPHENYWDRKPSAFIGLYANTVQDQYVKYVSPQENGYKTDVRWVTLTQKNGVGLLAVGQPTLCFSALPYSIEDLTQERRGTKHPTDLVERDFIELNIDYKQTGVGGDNSWGARPLDKYTLQAKEYSYSFRLRPFLSKNESPVQLSKQKY